MMFQIRIDVVSMPATFIFFLDFILSRLHDEYDSLPCTKYLTTKKQKSPKHFPNYYETSSKSRRVILRSQNPVDETLRM